MLAGTGFAAADTIDTTGQPPHERCGYCHEADGNPRMDTFPRIAGQHYDYLVKQLRDFRAGRREGTMEATAELLSDDDIVAAARYFTEQPARSMANNDTIPERAVAARLHTRGDDKRGIPACSGCHGRDGEGNGLIPRLAGQHAAYLETQLLGFKRGRRANDVGGTMRRIAARATEGELRALARYFANLRDR